ncbi:hypothetical protein Bca52824_015536 [Brassica carinata]|uniref:Uncharacterized protein n=1 Tax=Brassica carinata TaxID=52824 RepID=A0A8X7W1X5_BRACI|nr:hypothetical protein Bca52824_015536 [Brassica carinata]
MAMLKQYRPSVRLRSCNHSGCAGMSTPPKTRGNSSEYQRVTRLCFLVWSSVLECRGMIMCLLTGALYLGS